MQKSNAPTKLTVVFASGTGAGPVNDVPLTPGATPGTASYQTGFTSVNMEPIALGGVPPFGADFNGVIRAQTTAQIWQQAGYMWPFDSSFAGNSNIGGYPSGSVLLMGNGKGLWINQTDNNSASPDATGSSGWLGIPAAGIYTIATTGGTTTPDPSVLGVTTLLVSGALASNATIVLPLAAGSRWIVANNTTGISTLTVQGSSGAGVSITQGSALTVFTDGTAYYAASANISGAYLPIDGTAVAATKLATPRNFSITGFAEAAAVGFDGTGNVVFNVTSMNVAGALGYTPANDARVVHTTGNENIEGSKNFSQAVGVYTGIAANGPANYYQGFNNGVVRWSIGLTADVAWAIYTYDANGSYLRSPLQVGQNGALSIEADNTPTEAVYIGTSGTHPYHLTLARTDLGDAAHLWWDGATVQCTEGITCPTMNATLSDRRLKRNIRKFHARPLHRSARFVSYTLKSNGWNGLGSIAQEVRKVAPEHVGEFEQDGRKYLSLNYAGMAYEQAFWAGKEIDRLTKRIEKLERALDRAKIEPRKRGFVRRLLEAIW